MVKGAGFTLLEILIGFFVLAIAFVGMAAYNATQRGSLNRSGRLSDGTQIAMSALETSKAQLADSSGFRREYDLAGIAPRTTSRDVVLNNVHYTVDMTVTRAPAPLYALKVRSRVKWKASHAIEMGVLVPGATPTL